MSFLRGWTVAALVAGLSGLGCSSVSNYGAPPPCKGSHCSNPAGGGVVPPDGGGTGGGGGAAPGASDVTGTVHKITDPAFGDGAQLVFTGASTIVALSAVTGAPAIMAPYGGLGGPTTFTLPSVPAGLTWFMVEDGTSGASGVLSTLSQAQVPALTGVTLPVLELLLLQNIASSLPTLAVNGVASSQAQIILVLTHANGPYKGVTVSGSAGSAQVVYDTGPGTYTDSGTATGSAGTVILFNSSLHGSGTITLTDSTAMPPVQFQVPVQAAPGAATIVRADLQ